MQHANFLPLPKSSTPPIMIRNIVMAAAQARQNMDPDRLASFEEDTVDLAKIIREEEDEEAEDA
jgi:hypothetical protein